MKPDFCLYRSADLGLSFPSLAGVIPRWFFYRPRNNNSLGAAAYFPAIKRAVAAFGLKLVCIDRPFHLRIDDGDIGMSTGFQSASVDG